MFDMRLPLLLLLASALVLPGCATVRSKKKLRSEVRTVLDQAIDLMGESKIRIGRTPFRSDCSGFVTACYSRVGMALIDPAVSAKSGTELIFKSLKKRGRIVGVHGAKAGDLAFFHNTWDKNGNRIRDDRFTHIALVERVEGDGRVQIVHFVSGKVKRGYISPAKPGQARDKAGGRILNSHLRRGGGNTLTGQLLFRFGRPLPR
jgi:hypothetical protein